MLKVFDGFDHYTDETDIIARSGYLQYTLATASAGRLSIVSPGLTGFGKRLRMHSNGIVQNSAACLNCSFGGTLATGFFGFRMHATPLGSTSTTMLLYVYSAGLLQMSYEFNAANGQVSVRRGKAAADVGPGTLLGSSATNAWTPGAVNFVEVGHTIDNSAGAAEVRVNGNSVLSLTGVDTQDQALASFDAIEIIAVQTVFGNYLDIDDLYFCDDTVGPGAYPGDSFMGDLRTATLFATGDDSVQWTPLAGANWQELAETAMDSDTSYNSTATPGDKDSFVFEPLVGTISQAIAVQVTGAFRKDEGGARTVQQFLTSGATESDGAVVSLSNDYKYFTDIFLQDPDGDVDWTVLAVNGLKAGYQLVS